MARRRLPEDPIEIEIEALDSRGRGRARFGERPCLVRGALPGERVAAEVKGRRRGAWVTQTVDVLEAAGERVSPRCPHTDICGGCALQHMDPEAQRTLKRTRLEHALSAHDGLAPSEWLPTVVGPNYHYRRRARLSVRDVPGKGRVLVGFREPNGRYVADIHECHVLERVVAERLPDLAGLVESLDARGHIPQIEVACGDDVAALVFRHLEPLSSRDQQALTSFAQRSGLAIYLQPGAEDSVHPLHPEAPELRYALPDFGVTLRFGPLDFIQVNAAVNRSAVRLAVDLLAPELDDRVLDLFCGLGNFSLPLATRCREVLGLEGAPELVETARRNAAENEIDNARFDVADLYTPAAPARLDGDWSLALLDPPRTGAAPILGALTASGIRRLVYVSCHPGSLADDAAALVAGGFRLTAAGIMDMFPHTAHVESIAVFERDRR